MPRSGACCAGGAGLQRQLAQSLAACCSPVLRREPVNKLVGEFFPTRDGLPPGCSGDYAVENNVDGETKPLVAITGDHLRGMGDEKREPVGR